MTKWTAVVLALPVAERGAMVSRLPPYLHPVAGRPLIWHTVSDLALGANSPSDVLVVAPPELTVGPFDGLPFDVELRSIDPIDGKIEGSEPVLVAAASISGRGVVAVHASAALDPDSLRRLIAAEPGTWIGESDVGAAAVRVAAEELARMLRSTDPFALANGYLAPRGRLEDTALTFVVQSRADLARVHGRIRDQLIGGLMEAGATFILPETVVVDVDVRIGRDSVVYPGVVLEGQTTVGEETVIGPGCRIVDSWIGSGVELKGWNYIANTSVRNRAILEPYVRRGFD